jgi:hypothetical protein
MIFLGLIGLQVIYEAFQLRYLIRIGELEAHPAFRGPVAAVRLHADGQEEGLVRPLEGRPRPPAVERESVKEDARRAKVDAVLEKVSREGIGSLSPRKKRSSTTPRAAAGRVTYSDARQDAPPFYPDKSRLLVYLDGEGKEHPSRRADWPRAAPTSWPTCSSSWGRCPGRAKVAARRPRLRRAQAPALRAEDDLLRAPKRATACRPSC